MASTDRADVKELLLAYLTADTQYRAVEQRFFVESVEIEGRAALEITPARLRELDTLARDRDASRAAWLAALLEREANGPRGAPNGRDAIPIRAEDYPVLAAIWDNDDDAAYDEL